MAKDLRPWTVRDSAELYGVENWGASYFSIGDNGNLFVHPRGPNGPRADLRAMTDDISRRGLTTPLLLRFSDVLNDRVSRLSRAFQKSIETYNYKSSYRPIMPVKVNQQRHVIEELVQYGRPYNLGLEAGSKPELLIVLAFMNDPEAVIVCNGYKDSEYIETALLAQKLGRKPFIVLDRFAEAAEVIAVSRRIGVRPLIGARVKLNARGAGKWNESTGERSKFGLNASEMVKLVELLEKEKMLDCLQLLHFHIGSQITHIRAIRDAVREASIVFCDLHKMGANLKYLDVGGGLAIDYDGSRSNFHSSKNYSLQEYANDIVSEVGTYCDERHVPHPTLLSESGRALVAHHAMLVFDVLGVNELQPPDEQPEPPKDAPAPIQELWNILKNLSHRNYQELYNDLLVLREDIATDFSRGRIDLKTRALAEQYMASCTKKFLKILDEVEKIPDELENVRNLLTDTYFCNFSIFQSIPDHWAVDQLFPIMPIHRLNEKPSRRGTIADLTCDSDGKIDEFIDPHDTKHFLELHRFKPGEPYYLGVFLVGAYQEILGDLHNLFGDTNAVHVKVNDDSSYTIGHVVQGDSVTDVLSYVEYDKSQLVNMMRDATEMALRDGRITFEEARQLISHYDRGLAGYTYLEQDG
ncbi:MAG: biosynthetic arginine decarboxylase [Deltaproteobacteria bacterium]|nr:biosynthetic arginine decarboxylase [Deltaproteobacteria bacterium]